MADRNAARTVSLPPVAFAAHPTTGATVMIRRRRAGYYGVATRLTAEDLNRVFGVSAEEAYAMLAGSMFGWDCAGADPSTYVGVRGRGRRKKDAPEGCNLSGAFHRHPKQE